MRRQRMRMMGAVLAYTGLQGVKPICEHQLVQTHLFDMFTNDVLALVGARRLLIARQHGS